MIASLKGIVENMTSSYSIIDVNGVGYKVLLSSNVLSKLIIGDKVKFFIYSHVREDVFDLYGFLEQEELKLFEYLISVSGVGPKTALGVFSVGDKETIVKAITTADLDFFTDVPRLGKKNAQKIIIELKERLGSVADLNLSDKSNSDELVIVLKNFGFSLFEAKEAIKAVKGQGETIEEKVKLALKYLGK